MRCFVSFRKNILDTIAINNEKYSKYLDNILKNSNFAAV